MGNRLEESKPVSVITLTHGRESELIRCLNSVKSQDYKGTIEHIIIGDSSEPLKRLENKITADYPNAAVFHMKLGEHERDVIPFYTPSRTGAMRNFGISRSKGEFICHLDDDNTFDTNHVSSLIETIESEPGVDIAYSWRRLVSEDGTPYINEEYPWTPDARFALDKTALSRYIYRDLMEAGIRVPGTNIVRDAVLTPAGEPFYTVDTSELMVRRSVHNKVLFTVKFPWRQMVGDYSDDYAFVRACHETGLKFKSSEKVTLTYTLGGVSNRGVKHAYPAGDGKSL